MNTDPINEKLLVSGNEDQLIKVEKCENLNTDDCQGMAVDGVKDETLLAVKSEIIEDSLIIAPDSLPLDSSTDKLAASRDNPYAYLDRDDFTSEKFKIEIHGLPKYYGIKELKKLLNDKLMLSSSKLKPPRKYSSWVFVCFRSEEDRQSALKTLDGYKWKNKTLHAKVANPAPDPLVRKRKLKEDMNEDGNESKKEKLCTKTQEERLKDSTTPYWNLPYEEQLKLKENNVRKLLEKMSGDLVIANPELKPWIEKQKLKHSGLPCELWGIKKSPIVSGYRNKCEFTIGLNEETGERTVGFRLGSYVRGFIGVGPIDSLYHVPQRMKDAVKIFEQFVRKSEFEVFNPETHEGYWRQLTARLTTATDQLMLIVGFHPQQLTVEQLSQLKDDIKNFFTDNAGQACNISSLYFEHIHKKKAGIDLPPVEHLLGDTHIHETLCGLKFRISAEAFFQVNTAAAEVLYNTAQEISSPSQDTTLIDICCGTGSIGLCFAQHCGQVLGLELLPQAVDDAKANATINGIDNCSFYPGRAEDILPSVMAHSVKKDILAVVDPPRAGLHQRALIALRRNLNLHKLVFLSCDPKAALKNFVDLSRSTSKMYKGTPLIPIRAVPVDMFPHTPHCELIVYFERLDLNAVNSNTDNALSHGQTSEVLSASEVVQI